MGEKLMLTQKKSENRLNEQELVEGCKAQNPRIQKEVYEKYSRGMYALCLRYVKDTAEAEDILIIGFRKVFDRIHQFRGDGSFPGWIRRIMVNECLAYLEKNKALFQDIGMSNILPSGYWQKPSDELEVDDLMNLINSLPTGYKSVFNLYAIEGYSHQEIAEKLQITVGTSKSQLSRARIHIQRMISVQANANQDWMLSA
jgi:RNA polymerase sigma factor (sigma-70 family)